MAQNTLSKTVFLFFGILVYATPLQANYQNVLVVNSYHEGMPWNDSLIASIKQTFKDQKEPVNLYIEYLDSKRIHGTIFDYETLQVYGISPNKLSTDSRLINQSETFFQRHQSLIIACGIIFTGYVIILIILLSNVKRRKNAESTLRLHQEQLGALVEQKTIELKNSEERYRLLYNDTPAMLHSIDKDGNLISVSDYWLETMGYDRSEVIGSSVLTYLTKACQQQVKEEAIPRLVQEGKVQNFAYQFVKKSGEIIDIEWSAIAQLDANGTFRHSVAVSFDVTNRKQAEKALQESVGKLQESEERHRMLLQNAGMGIGYYTPQGEAVLFNERAIQNLEDIFGQNNYKGKSVYELFGQELGSFIMERIKTTINSTTPQYFEDEFNFLNRKVWFYSVFSKLINETGKVLGVQIISDDITQRKQMEEELRIAKEQAEIANQAKSVYLANMSHEIRTPLNSIVGFAQILSNQAQKLPVSDDFKAYLQLIQTSGNDLSELINNILDLSKIEAGKIDIQKETLNLRLLIQSIFQINKAEAAKHDISLHYEFSSQLPEFVISDRTKINQILMNLLSNAIKFTAVAQQANHTGESTTLPENKKIILRVTQEKFQRESWLVFEVEDAGIGISKEDQKTIFEPFQQADRNINRRVRGSGLGLAIVKSMVDLLGGKINLKSHKEMDQSSGGSCFTVHIPLMSAEDKETGPGHLNWEDNHFSEKNRILVVEDNPTNQKMIQALFRELGLEIELAASGEEGVEKTLAASEKNQPFDLILMDIHMPEVDGIAASQKIQLSPACHKIPIIALSAEVFDFQQQTALSAGISDYLLKPIQVNELVAILVKYLKQDQTASTVEQIPRKPLPDDLKVQLLDEFKTLAEIPHFYNRRIRIQIDKMTELCRAPDGNLYESPYLAIMRNIQYMSDSGNSEEISTLINEALNVQYSRS